jgi:hypothetical protein
MVVEFKTTCAIVMSRYIVNEVEASHHLILIRLYFILTILITEDDHNHIIFSNTLTFFHTCTSRSRSFITTLQQSSEHFFPALDKGLYQTESYSLHVMQLIIFINYIKFSLLRPN